ncbi:hypothetical protein JAAARDRAFT_451542 [Jaapia argillacea MUCL 33604]|uniref:Uncharacterized protein n=1 Tax=Jaapia argillacea MUCL 33604 TaxID=933084 RepID=A0A067QHV3_9AGAM|nr:hypothetical protein JAAARDRAFT_451542 [Jaapia argillacea MUCL 33604]
MQQRARWITRATTRLVTSVTACHNPPCSSQPVTSAGSLWGPGDCLSERLRYDIGHIQVQLVPPTNYTYKSQPQTLGQKKVQGGKMSMHSLRYHEMISNNDIARKQLRIMR